MNKYNSKTIIIFTISIFLFVIIYNKNREHFIGKEKSTESKFDVFDLKKFEKKDIQGKAGDLEKHFGQNSGRLWLGSWDSGKCGDNYYVYDKSNKKVKIGSVQVLLSGKHNTGANKSDGESSQQTINELSKKMYQADNRDNQLASYKLRIEGYDNGGSWVYPMHCSDKEGNIDFSIRNRISLSGVKKINRSLCTMAGDLFITNDLTINGGELISNDGNIVLDNGSINIGKGNLSLNKDIILSKGSLLLHDSNVRANNVYLNNLSIKKSPKNTPNIYSNCTATDSFTRCILKHLFPRGTIIIFDPENHTIPEGWEECDGGSSNKDYPPVLKKPDLRGKSVFGKYNIDGFNFGQKQTSLGEGRISSKLFANNIPNHMHIINSQPSGKPKSVTTSLLGTHTHYINSNTGDYAETHNHGNTIYDSPNHTHALKHTHTVPKVTNLNNTGSHQHKYNDFHYASHYNGAPHGSQYGLGAGANAGKDYDNYYWQHYRNASDMQSTGSHSHYIPSQLTDKSDIKNTKSSDSHKHSLYLYYNNTYHNHYINLQSDMSGEHNHNINIDRTSAHNHGGNTHPEGNNREYNNMPPYRVLMYIIKVF